MNLSFLSNAVSNLDSLSSPQVSGLLQSITTPSPELLSKLSSISMENILWTMGGLMLFRIFGGVLFSVLALFGLVLSTLTSIVCTSLSVVIKIFGTSVNSIVSLFGSVLGHFISSPIKLASSVLSRWGHFFIPVIASGLMSTFYLQGNPFASLFSHFESTPSAWVAIESNNSKEELFERF